MNEHSIAGYTLAASPMLLSGDHVLHAAERAYRGLLADQPRHFRALCGLAVVRGQLGAADEARDLLDRAAAAANGHVGDHIVLGAAFARINDLDGARRHFEQAIRLDERHGEARLQLANILHRAGQIDAAVGRYEEALAIDPNSAEAHQSLGLALQSLGRFEAAIPHHEAARTIEPRLAMAHVGLGDAYRRLGRYHDAIPEYQRALAINAGLAEVHLNLGGSLQIAGHREDAIRSYQRTLAINPAIAGAHHNLGVIYADLDDLHAAAFHYERAIELNPASAEAHNNLANVLCRQQREQEAIKHYREAVRLKPRYADALRNLGDALQTQKSFEEAIACFRAALAIEPDSPTILNRLAAALLVTGEIDEASRIYEAAIALSPQDVGIQLNYATVRPFTDGDRRLVQLEQAADREAELSEEQRIALHFALGKAHADLRDGERSFHHLSIANLLKRRHVVYDERETLRYMERVRAAFSDQLLRARSGKGDPSDAPIFVVGMPRSGTSLVEQILASHPRVRGAGELTDFAATAAMFAESSGGVYPEMIAKMADGSLREFGGSYVERIRKVAASPDRFVDKMPSNFLFLGLIHVVLPRACIIHVRRDPVDNCLSCYSLLFSEGQPFAYDLAELGRYYRAYEALMQHWRSVLPPATMLEVRYEDLVGDLEGQGRQLVAHCGLEWDERCLSFHETKRPVETASLVQVRQPIHAGAIGRSRLYGARLAPLLNALEGDGPAAGHVSSATTDVVADEKELERQVDRALRLAKHLQGHGDIMIAEQLFSFVAAARSGDYEALLALGTICANSNRQDDAKRYFRQLIDAHGNAPNAHGSLGAVHASCGELTAAVACYEKALTLAPDHPGVRYAYAMVLTELGCSAEAIAQIRLALAKRPDHLESHFALGNLLYGQGQNAEAIQCYAKVLQFSPRHAETHNNLGNVLLQIGQHERAIAHYKTAIEINPAYADAHGNLGNAFLELNRLEESIAQNRRALELKPQRFGSYNNLGVALQALGRFEEAQEAFARAIELAPQEASVHLNLANMERFKPDDRRLPALRRLLDGVDALDDERQIAARFAMGKALSDLKHYDDAFVELSKGNALKRRQFVYDEGQRLEMLEKIRTVFTEDLIASRSEHGDRSWSPIFIVGMPRSGTTLMEQVLASHSKVFGAGELETFKEMVIGAVDSQAIFPAYPELVGSLSPETIRRIGETYTSRVRVLAPDAAHIVDKMPLNFAFVGLIHMALPNAKIIHTRRDPLDTCVSCYSLLFTGNQPFAYDLAELGRYHRACESVMEHWHRVLPQGTLIDVKYEDLVDNLEGVSREALRHCGLEWEDACLNFHDTERTVRTASLMQVRKPIYRSAMGGWRRYAKHLKPLADALGGDIPAIVARAAAG
jgi:tetratricopeptide (TPR) repeat protein